MPKKYSETEKENIRRDLRRQAERLMAAGPVRRITVDEIVKAAAIPKGTFYLFYPHKEALFFDVIRSFRLEMQEEMLSLLQELDENHIVTSLTTVFSHLLDNMYERGIWRLFEEEELQCVMRPLPEGTLDREVEALQAFFAELFSYFAIDDEDDISRFHSAFMMIVLSMGQGARVAGARDAWRTLLRGLMLQLVGE